MTSPILLVSLGIYDGFWLAVSGALMLCAAYVGVGRQLLAVFSRKRLLEITPEAERERIESYLDNEDEYVASLRGLDLLLRLAVVLSLAFGRLVTFAGGLAGEGLLHTVLEWLTLGVEIVLILFVFLEILPGILARIRPEERLLRRLKTLDRIHRLFAPVRVITAGLVRRIVVLLGGQAERTSADILEDEILSAAEEGEREGLLKSRDIDMIESIITFGNVEVSEVMTPRTEMVCLDVDEPLDASLDRAIECGHSRIPVYRESKDNIIGLLYVKDLLRFWHKKEEISLERVLRKPHFVPLTKKIGELFQEFKSQRFHIAIILDEFGGTAGLITIEDIIEEIVGEITDEFEKIDKPAFRRVSHDVVDVDASLHIDDLNDQLETDLPEAETYDTVGGFLVSQLGRIPAVGETLEFDSLRFEVSAADERRIHRIRIRLPHPGPGEKP